MTKGILILGGCGYVGTPLVKYLLDKGKKVTVVDTEWFGNFLPKNNDNLEVIREDIRNIQEIVFENKSLVIHLANICNDPSVDLDPVLSWEVNVLATKKICDYAVKFGLSKILYASSGSVYGISDKLKVTEDVDLKPISTYNKTKMVSERVISSYSNEIKTYCIRPATVCGWSPRMRLDVSVNMLTYQALSSGVIKVFGGDQVRPNIHISDMIRVYDFFIENSKLESGYYNAGFENISIIDLAKKIQKKINCRIEIIQSNDPRSYRQDSSKLLSKGFQKKFSVDDAINELIEKYNNKLLNEDENSYTVKKMKELSIK